MIRNNVEIRPFEDCIKKVKYTKKVASQDFKESGRFPIVSQEEAFISGYWDNPDDVFSIDGPVVIFGDHSRHVKYVDFDFVIGADGVKILAPVDDINAKYFYYYLKSQRIQSLGYSRHYKVLKEKMVPVPSLADQQRIVDELDLLSGIVEKKNAQLKIMGDLEQSVFYEMFDQPDSSSFPVFKLSQLSRQKLSYGSGASAVEFNGNVRYVRITDIQEDGTLTENSMSPDSYDEKYLLHEGDILFARSGATVGKTFLYNKQDGKSIYAGYLIRFVPDVSVVYPEYIYHFTRSQYYKAFVRANAQAVAQPNINAQQYGNLEICVPPMSLQKDFVERIMSIDSQKATIRRSIKVAQNLLASRLDNYFNV